MNHPRLHLLTIAVLACVTGCGEAPLARTVASVANTSEQAYFDVESNQAESAASLAMQEPIPDAVRFATHVPQDRSETGTATAATLASRKIIYNSMIALVVEDYRQFEARLPGVVAQFGGFIAKSDTDRQYQSRQSGTWVVRVPVTVYSQFLTGVGAMGFAESRSENAQDVTEEFVDVQARIKNKRSLEQRIVAMLDERTGKLSDVLEIERELARVREEIERMEGRMRFLADRTSLATVTIQCREQKQYQPAAAPTLGARVTQSWTDSLGSIRMAGENVLVAAIAIAPWLLVLLIPGVLLWRTIRWRVSARRLRTAA